MGVVEAKYFLLQKAKQRTLKCNMVAWCDYAAISLSFNSRDFLTNAHHDVGFLP